MTRRKLNSTDVYYDGFQRTTYHRSDSRWLGSKGAEPTENRYLRLRFR